MKFSTVFVAAFVAVVHAMPVEPLDVEDDGLAFLEARAGRGTSGRLLSSSGGSRGSSGSLFSGSTTNRIFPGGRYDPKSNNSGQVRNYAIKKCMIRNPNACEHSCTVRKWCENKIQ
ncbi:hypothetical protein UVI_02050670 [Ustilaginoidea virens]|uniref:Uncharacterized protein n=1 Tax=Ustilaginoidea virens TaxID=1159556 RepID=A0A1B5KZR8_USTVR|nr:hypothetical protein UVI_02050670 [Ustilaginoidea virens]